MARETVITGEFRGTYLYINEPRKKNIDGKPLPEDEWTYECGAIFPMPKDMTKEDRQAWDAMIILAKGVKEAAFGAGEIADYSSPITLGNTINAKRLRKKQEIRPEIVDKQVLTFKSKKYPVGVCQINPGGAPKTIMNPAKEVYAGAYYIAEVSCYSYDMGKEVGVRFGINNLMKVRDGEPLGAGGRDAVAAFQKISEGASPEEYPDNSSEFGDDDCGV